MELKQVMHRDISGVNSDASMAEAMRKLSEGDGTPLPIYENDRLVGLLTLRDVMVWEGQNGRDPNTTKVASVMRRDVPYAFEDQDVRDAVRRIREKHVDGLVVLTNDRRLSGIVSLADLVDGAADDTGSAPPVRVFLQPIAPPSILGLYGFAGATFIVAAHLAGLYGTDQTPYYLFPFAALFGGLAQFIAGIWSHRARDGIATAMHGMWGSFWMAYGLLQLLFATNVIAPATGAFPELGFWFIALAAITWMGTLAALGRNITLTAVLGSLALGATFMAIAEMNNDAGWREMAGWTFIASAILAWYLASAMMIEGAYGRVILPIGSYQKAANVPGSKLTVPVEYRHGEPGVRAGQ